MCVWQLKAKNLTVEEEGALLMWCRPKFEIPLFVRKSDGGYGCVTLPQGSEIGCVILASHQH